ncbi:hypothetical protein ABK040_010258 [Willaertia magna]
MRRLYCSQHLTRSSSFFSQRMVCVQQIFKPTLSASLFNKITPIRETFILPSISNSSSQQSINNFRILSLLDMSKVNNSKKKQSLVENFKMDSVKRKRKKMMKKHQHRKRLKKTRSLRKRLGKR